MTNYTTDLLHAENLLKQAIEMDKKGSLIEARDLYITTIEFCLECVCFLSYKLIFVIY